MWEMLFYGFVVATFLVLIGIEIVRSQVHRYRERRYGIGGTQDIATWGTLLDWLCIVGTFISGFVWWLT